MHPIPVHITSGTLILVSLELPREHVEMNVNELPARVFALLSP